MRFNAIRIFLLFGVVLLFSSVYAANLPPPDSTASASRNQRDSDRRFSFGLLTGIWMPRGNTELLGNKFQIGMYMGGRVHGWGADLLIGFRLGQASNQYQVVHDGEFVATDHFLGAQILLLTCKRLLKAGSHETEVQIGLGIDAFDAIEDEENPKTIVSFGNSFGLAHYFLVADGFAHVGLQLQYSFVAYDTDGGSDLSGNTLSLNLLLGIGGPVVYRPIVDEVED